MPNEKIFRDCPLVEGGRAAVLKPASSKPFTTKENRREETILDSAGVSPNDLCSAKTPNSCCPWLNWSSSAAEPSTRFIDVTGRAAIQAVLELSAQQVTGGKLSQPGKKRRGDVVRWGRQPGRVKLSNRKLRVSKPRLRKRSGGEVKVPAYEAMQDDERLGARMLDILMKGSRRATMPG